MPAVSTSEPRRLDLTGDPESVFAGLAHRDGAIFLDSALETGQRDLSILGAEPEEIVTGHLSDSRNLEAWLEQNSRLEGPDLGFPAGGAIGYVSYEGDYAFGLYRDLLIFRHDTEEWFGIGNPAWEGEIRPAAAPDLAPFREGMSPEAFQTGVRRAKDYIAAGDIYQVNLSHRFSTPWPDEAEPFELYRALRHVSPAPYAAYLNLGGRRVLSSSPEQFLKMSGSFVQTRPIKGTKPRFRDQERDERSAYDLITSEKEIAELIMITDLERNDLGQVCEFGSVRAAELLKLERYEHVFHLVSTVEGTLRPGVSQLAALRACFPGGSISGAPKKRAMEIIAELETGPRGIYTGAIGYLGLNGESQFNIAIRTAVVENGELHFHVGAGIVADSDETMEYEETLHKAAGIVQAVELTRNQSL